MDGRAVGVGVLDTFSGIQAARGSRRHTGGVHVLQGEVQGARRHGRGRQTRAGNHGDKGIAVSAVSVRSVLRLRRGIGGGVVGLSSSRSVEYVLPATYILPRIGVLRRWHCVLVEVRASEVGREDQCRTVGGELGNECVLAAGKRKQRRTIREGQWIDCGKLGRTACLPVTYAAPLPSTATPSPWSAPSPPR